MAAKPTHDFARIGRRAFLVGAGAGLGLFASRGFAPLASARADAAPIDVDVLLRELVASMRPAQRALALFDAEHPSRQVANTVSFLDRPQIGELFDARQRVRIERLVDAALSPHGREDMAATIALEGRVGASVLAIYGDPHDGPSQAVIAGGHYTLRAGTDGRGGALAYGQQVGNERYRVEGNAFARHGDLANWLVRALRGGQREAAILEEAPNEHVLQPLGAGRAVPGIARTSLTGEAAEAFDALLSGVLETFAPDRGRRVETASLSFSTFAKHGYYSDMVRYADLEPAERAARGEPYWQVWRLEGPDAVVHFQGHPHVHAYVQITDPSRANVGERVAHLDRALEGEPMRDWIESAMRSASGEALAYQPLEVTARLAAGDVTTGQLYTLEPYGNRIAVAEIEGRAMAAPLRAHVERASGAPVDPRARIRVAVDEYVASRRDWFGEASRVERSRLELREALVAYARAAGMA